jgi:hypothetical protein
MCVSFGSSSYTVWRGTCTSSDKVNGPVQANGDAQISGAAFTQLTPTQGAATVVFTARGTASGGEVHVTRPGSTKDYKIKVDGFTGRVSLCDESGCNGV